MFLNHSPLIQARSLPYSVAFMGLISHLSIGTMKVLRLPSLFSLSSVSLDFDTAYDVAPFLSLNWMATYTQLTRMVGVWSIRNTIIRVEAGGSPVFPYIPCLPLKCP